MAAIKSASFELLNGDIYKIHWALAIPTSLSDLDVFEGQNDARKWSFWSNWVQKLYGCRMRRLEQELAPSAFHEYSAYLRQKIIDVILVTTGQDKLFFFFFNDVGFFSESI